MRQVIERWKPALKYLAAKQFEKDRVAERLLWFSTGLITGIVLVTLWISVAAI